MSLNLRPDKRPLALKVRDRLHDLLREQQFRAGDRIPSEESLGRTFGVSRATVREALKYLEEERIIVCRHGSGRYMAAAPGGMLDEEITRLQSVTEMAQTQGIEISTRVLDLRVEIPSEEIRTHLELNQTEKVIALERARLSDGQIVIYSLDIFPAHLLPGPPDPARFTGSLLKLLESRGTRLQTSKTTIRAVLLDKALAASLGVDPAAPWILLEQINYDHSDRPVLYSRDYHNAEKFQFRVVRRRR